MKAWRSAFSAVAIYIGGAEQACAAGNLSVAWVRSVRSMRCYVSNAWWPGQRVKQFMGPHLRTVGGLTVDIDSDWFRGRVY